MNRDGIGAHPNMCVIALDETCWYTEHFDYLVATGELTADERGMIGHVYGCYLFDRHLFTYLCCIQPSYWLENYDRYLTTSRVLTPTEEEVWDRLRDRLSDAIAPTPEDSHYSLVSDMDAIIGRTAHGDFHDFGEDARTYPEIEADTGTAWSGVAAGYDAYVEAFREHVQGNSYV